MVRLFDGQRPVNNQTVKVYPEEFRGNQTIKKMMKYLFRFGLLLFGLAIVPRDDANDFTNVEIVSRW